MSEVERCPECGGLAGPDGVLSHGYVHVRHETGGGGMNRRCSQTPKPEEPTVVAGGGGYDPRALTALAKNLDKARDWAAWFAAEAAYWRDGAKLMDALVLLGEASKAMSDRDAEVARLREELDEARRTRDQYGKDYEFATLDCSGMRAQRDAALRERDKAIKDLSDARFKLGVANGQLEATLTAANTPLDPESPADLRRAADLLEALSGDTKWSEWSARDLREKADAVEAKADAEARVEEVARTLWEAAGAFTSWDTAAERYRDPYRAMVRGAIAKVEAQQ